MHQWRRAARGDDATLHEKQQNVGLSAAPVLGGRTVFNHAMGFANLEQGIPATRETACGAASLTKVVTAVLVLQLWSEGGLGLDARAQRYVPSLPERPEGTITPRLLATHRSGLPHAANRTPELFTTHYGSAMEALAVFRDVSPVSRPGPNSS